MYSTLAENIYYEKTQVKSRQNKYYKDRNNRELKVDTMRKTCYAK